MLKFRAHLFLYPQNYQGKYIGNPEIQVSQISNKSNTVNKRNRGNWGEISCLVLNM